jgi:acyl-CoA thioesterase-1
MRGKNKMNRPWFAVWLTVLTLTLAACQGPATLAPLPKDAKVLAFGDSITYGLGAAPDQSYPAVLETLIGRSVINAGMPGEITEDAVKRLPEALDRHRPQLMILCHGINDLMRPLPDWVISDNLRAMIRIAQARRVGVFLIAAPRIRLLIAPAGFYHSVAAEFGIPAELGILSQVIEDETLRLDRIHPNAKGYRIVAEAVAAQLRKAGVVQ